MAFLYHNPEIWQLPNKQSMEKKMPEQSQKT